MSHNYVWVLKTVVDFILQLGNNQCIFLSILGVRCVQLGPDLLVLLHEVLALNLELRDLASEQLTVFQELLLLLQDRSPLRLGHQRLPHTVGDRRIVKALVRCQLLSELVAHSDEEEASLGAVDCDLSDHLVEALLIQRLSHGTDAAVPCLALLQPLIEQVLQEGNVYRSRGHGRNIPDPQFALSIGKLLGWQD